VQAENDMKVKFKALTSKNAISFPEDVFETISPNPPAILVNQLVEHLNLERPPQAPPYKHLFFMILYLFCVFFYYIRSST